MAFIGHNERPGRLRFAYLGGVDESEELRRSLSRIHPLVWENPLPSRGQIAARHGRDAADAAFLRLAAVVPVEHDVTRAVLASIPPGAEAHQLDRRVKSPASLARRIALAARAGNTGPAGTARVMSDVLRYTMLVDEPDELVGGTLALTGRLAGDGWTVQDARHSYVEGSRYRGLHTTMRTAAGTDVEFQFHSRASWAVKETTTRLYEVNRDPDRPPHEREEAQLECVRLSDQLRVPAGLNELTELGGCPVQLRRFGIRLRTEPDRPAEVPEVLTRARTQPAQTRETGREA